MGAVDILRRTVFVGAVTAAVGACAGDAVHGTMNTDVEFIPRPAFTDDETTDVLGGEDFAECFDLAIALGLDDLGLRPDQADRRLAETEGLASIAGDADPDALIALVERALQRCGDVEEQARRMVDLLIDDGVPPELAVCVTDQWGDGGVVEGVAIRAVHGRESPEARELDARQRAAMFRCAAEDMTAVYEAQGVPPQVATCLADQHRAAADEIDADPESMDTVSGEAATTARAARCRAVWPAMTPDGDTTGAVGVDRLTAAVAAELSAGGPSTLDAGETTCLADALVRRPSTPAASRPAAELVAYFDGGFEPDALGLSVDEEAAAELAAGAVDCAGPDLLRRTALVDGNFDDALGRPTEPAAERADLVACSLAAVDPTVLEEFLAAQFAIGPDAWRSPSGRTLLERSFAAVQGCADELGISRRDPVGEI